MMLKTIQGVMHEQFCTALSSQALTRTGIKFSGNGIKRDLSETGDVGSLGEILPEQVVGVLVAAALPIIVRVCKVGLSGAIIYRNLPAAAARANKSALLLQAVLSPTHSTRSAHPVGRRW